MMFYPIAETGRNPFKRVENVFVVRNKIFPLQKMFIVRYLVA